MFCKSASNSGLLERKLQAVCGIAALVVSVTVAGMRPGHAEVVDIYISDTDNRTVTVTAIDMNDGNKKLVSGYTLKHNERWSGKMLLDKDNNGHVKFEARAVDDKKCETRTYEGRQLPRGFEWQVSLKCN